MRGSVGATATATTLPSSSSFQQPKSNSVISSASAPSANPKPADEESLLTFLNAPATSTSAPSVSDRKASPVAYALRTSPPNVIRGNSAPPPSQEVENAAQSAKEAEIAAQSTKEALSSDEITKISTQLVGETGRAAIEPPRAASAADVKEDDASTEIAEERTETSLVGVEGGSSVAADLKNLTSAETPLAQVEVSMSSSSLVAVSTPDHSQSGPQRVEVVEDPFIETSAITVEDEAGRGQKMSSSNGSSVSGVSEDGEDADLSDALKDSPTSPFEESEPEMLTTSRYPRHAELAPSADVMETPHETPSEMRLSSGPQTESEPEMIPTPPSVGEVRLMTSSQVSSSISQRFSDCEILSATELAEIEDGGEVVSPPRKDSVEAMVTSVERQAARQLESVAPLSTSDSLSLSKFQLENELLRSEIQSLNEEMQSAWRQAQLAKEERVRAIQELEAVEKRAKEIEDRARDMSTEFARERKRNAAEAEERMREMERRLNDASALNADAQMSLEAKDGQLAVLRVRLEEADATIDQLRQKCASMEEENRRTVVERETTVATHATAFETLKSHADRLQEQLDVKSLEADRLREEVFTLENAAAEEKAGLGSMVTSLQSELATEKARSLGLQHQANGGQRAVDAAKKELEEYRAKATRTLQSKDRLIASLQEGSSTTTSASELELEDVKNERDLLREELDSVQSELESCRVEMADAEAQAAMDRDNFESRLSATEKDLRETKERLDTVNLDLATSKQELSCTHDQLHRTKIELQEQNLKKSEENENLRRQMQAQSSTAASSPDLEARLHALAENLIEKQTTIETLSTERNSLKLQLERMTAAGATKASLSGGNRSPSSVSIAVDDDRAGFTMSSDTNTRMRLPLFLRETPDDTGVTRGVKRAATSLDALGIKIGVFFRRYPVARVFALVYAFVLHLWVFVVLLTYTPEMH